MLLAFITGILFSPIFLIAIFVLSLGLEHHEQHGFALFLTIILGAVAYTMFSFTLLQLAYGAGGYLVIGILWSMYRWRKFCNRVAAEYTESKNQGGYQINEEGALRRIEVNRNKVRLVGWTLNWPLSFLATALSDVWDFVEMLIVKFFYGVYHRISGNAADKIKKATHE